MGVLIGSKGKTKKALQRKTKTRIRIDGAEGEIEAIGKAENASGFYIALDIIKAIGRGFSPKNAFLLLKEGNTLEILDITDYVKGTPKELLTKRGRIIGKNGKARIEIEEKTGCKISVQGKTIAIIGNWENTPKAKKAIELLLHGARHSKAFKTLDHLHRQETFDF